MRLSRWLLVSALAAGCAATQPLTGSGPVPLADPAPVEAMAVPGGTVFARDVAGALTAFAPPRSSGIGYVWLGYCGMDVPTGELSEVGSGDGFTFGAGFRVGDSARSFVEIASEKTLKHDMPATLADLTPPSGYHERNMIGGRTSIAALARLARQPRPYFSYGLAYENFQVNYASAPTYRANALGYYMGLGVEFPFAERSSLSFDAKYHFWEDKDTTGEEGMFGSVAFSILWLNRF